ncbi:tetratricopeptide repeat protein, partial [Cylindrospermum sp. FACHB-282]|uniref:tetratricopeptide repeat protein n=1 Tax=Cylindrospermum sp. FACHB-282 TaxID=2692794 RepID=UPI00168488C5
AIQLNPNYADAYNNLGIALGNQKKLDEAVVAFQKAIQLNPNYGLAYNNLGVALSQQKKLDQAVVAFQKALSLPDDTSGTLTTAHTLAHNGLGLVLQYQGKLKEAIEEFKKSIAIDPNYVFSQNNLQEARRLLGLRENPSLPVIGDRKWLPSSQNEPLVGVLRSVVRIIAEIPTGSNIGAGWVVKREGDTAWILTNRHVVTDPERTGRISEKIALEFFSEPPPGQYPPRYTAKILQITPANDPLDLALLKVTGIPEDIQPLPMYPGKVGRTTPVTIIGHPSNGGNWSAVSGEISNVLSQENKLQITATLAQGNSGGPVIDKDKKQVIGLMVQISDPRQQREDAAKSTQSSPPATAGFGFAYPMDVVIEKLRTWGVTTP